MNNDNDNKFNVDMQNIVGVGKQGHHSLQASNSVN